MQADNDFGQVGLV